MEQLTLAQGADNYNPNRTTNNTLQLEREAFKAGAEWQKEQYIELLILVEGFIKNAKPEQWCIDHYKEVLQKAIEPLQD